MRIVACGGILAGCVLLSACGSGGPGDSAAVAAAADGSPQIGGVPAGVAVVGSMYAFQPVASDPDGDPLVFGVDARPGWASFDTATGRLSGIPTTGDVGTARGVVIWASDGSQQALLPAFDITVQASAANRAPSISGTPSGAVAAGRNYDFTPAASDPDGDKLAFSVSGAPGWASFDAASGRLYGMPGLVNVGSYANIVISVSDGQSTSSLAPFSITVLPAGTNSAPSISGAPPLTVMAGSLYAFSPSASDPDGDALTFAVAGKPGWAAFDTATGALTGRPSAAGNYPGITISVSDGSASASLAPFAITVTAEPSNTAPVISGSPATTATTGVLYSFRPTASDADGDTLSYSIANKPSWATFNASTGRLRGTPSASDVGTTSGIVISVSDGQVAAALGAFAITVSAPPNQAPVISGTPPSAVTVGDSYAFQPIASDPDGDTLTFSISHKPSWASFDTATGRLQGVPADGDVNVYSNIVIGVSDGTDSASLAAFSITVQAIALGSATLSWAPPTENQDGSPLTDLAGYKVYWGQTSGSYPNSTPINNPGVTTYVIDNLSPGTYYFVATALNSSGVESAFSNEASKTIAP